MKRYRIITNVAMLLLFLGVNNAYGSDTPKEDTSSSATSYISGDELRKAHSWSLKAALQGRVPGLVITVGETMPTQEGYSISVRGSHTANINSPLIVVDGMIGGDLDYISLKDVESVEVLKDAAATIIYGNKGANGVIRVVTKRGEAGKMNLSVSYDYSLQKPMNSATPNFLGSADYSRLMNEAAENDGLGANYYYSDAALEAYSAGGDGERYLDQDWYGRHMQNSVQTHNVNVSSSGGSKIMKYYASLGYRSQGSPFNTEESERYNNVLKTDEFLYRTNIDIQVNKYLQAYMNLSGKVARQRDIPDYSRANIYSSLFTMDPTMYGPLTEDDQLISTTSVLVTPYEMLNRGGYSMTTTSSMNAQMGLNLDMRFITQGLSLKGNVGYYNWTTSGTYARHENETWVQDETNLDDLVFMKYGSDENTALVLSKGNTNKFFTHVDGSLDYVKAIGKHSVNASAFMRMRSYSKSSVTTANAPVLPSLFMTYGLIGNYNYNNVIVADFGLTYDGSEQFAPDNRYTFYPSAAVAWVVSNQDFMSSADAIDRLKVRASVGKVGNDDMGASQYPYKDNVSTSGASYVGELGGSINEARGNLLVQPEISTIYNLGVEVGFLDNWTVTADIFQENRSSILIPQLDKPSLSGWNSAQLADANNGEQVNKGVEFTLGYLKQFNRDFSLAVNGYFTYYKNEVIYSGEVLLPDTYAYTYRSNGYNRGQRWGYEVDYSNGNGYFNSLSELENSGLTYNGTQPRVGDLVYVDQNGDDVIDVEDKVPFDYTAMPRINYGLNITARYRKFDLSAYIQGTEMAGQFFAGYGFNEAMSNGTFFERHLSAWTEERYAAGEEILAPALSTTTSSSYSNNSNYNDRNVGYLRLKNIELGYTFPFSNKESHKARIYARVDNLLTIDHLQDEDEIDPEMNSYADYPISRFFNLGINITF